MLRPSRDEMDEDLASDDQYERRGLVQHHDDNHDAVDDNDKLLKLQQEWYTYAKRLSSKVTKGDIKSVAILVLVLFIMVRFCTTNATSPPLTTSVSKSLRHSASSADEDEVESPNTHGKLKKHLKKLEDIDEEEDNRDPTANIGSNVMQDLAQTIPRVMPQQNFLQPGLMQQQSQAAQQAMLQAQQQQQQQTLLQAQQQQQLLLQAQALQDMQDQIKAQQAAAQQAASQQAAAQPLLQQLLLQQQVQPLLGQQLQLLAQQSGTTQQAQPQLDLNKLLMQPGFAQLNSLQGQGGVSSDATSQQLNLLQGMFPPATSLLQSGLLSDSGGSVGLQTLTAAPLPQILPSFPEKSSNEIALPSGSLKIPLEDALPPKTLDASGGGVGTPGSLDSSSSEEPLVGLDHFRDSWSPYNANDIPIYFHVPKAGGSTVKDVIGSCHRMVMASEFGVTDGHDRDTEIAVVYPKVPGGTGKEDRSPFVNIDASTVAGIERAAKMGFADSGLADCVVTPFLYESNTLFTDTAQGRLFAVFRHPVDRAVSMFYYIQVADWEPSYMPELQSWTLEQYATSSVIENNWMTRQLANQPSGDLDESHLRIALEVIRRKFMVGLMKKLKESMTRFEKFFRWKFHVNPTNQEACRERLTGGGSNSNEKNKKVKPKPGDPLWDLIAAQNQYDIQLYEYIETLFVEQEAFVADIPDDFRLIDATCCKCTPPTFPPEGFACPKQVLNTS